MELLGTSAIDLERAARAIRDGLLVAIPTETVYGLGANAWDCRALARIFAVKNRPSFDPLIIHVATPADATQVADVSVAHAQVLMDHFWPGPLTLVLPKRARVPDLATSGLPTVAVRCPANAVAREIIRRAAVPVAAPSANPFGYLSPTRAEHVAAQLGGRIDFIVDGGRCSVGVESTVLDLSADPPLILRPGGLPVELIRDVLPTVEIYDRATSSPRAPGQLPSHYAPTKSLFLVPNGGLGRGQAVPSDSSGSAGQGGSGADSQASQRHAASGRRLAALCFGRDSARAAWASGVYATVVDLSPDGDPVVAAAILFERLHELDQGDCDAIQAERLPDQGIGRAVNDRLQKASVKALP
jgi:L-threonylcarbamoyladenylate synthase